ncbi:hypothetical protein BH20ACT2_BH20ACT2_18110 [soil metagenome]
MRTSHAVAPSRPRWLWRDQRWVWLLPPTVWLLIVTLTFLPILLTTLEAVAGLIALGLIILITRAPDRALRIVIAGLPFTLLAMAGLYKIGVPGEAVRQLGLWKELLVGGIVVAAVQKIAREKHRLDLVDRLALAYVALGTAYLMFPGFLTGGGPGADIVFSGRLLGWRTDVLYVLLFFGARHLRMSGDQVRKVMRTVVGTGIAAAAVGIFEFFNSDLWNRIATEWFQVNQYKLEVLNVEPLLVIPINDIRVYGEVAGNEFVRIGSAELSYLPFSFFSVVVLAAALELLVRRGRQPLALAAVGLASVALAFTQTRSAIASGALGLCLVALPALGRAVESRLRIGLLIGMFAIIGLPAAVGAGLADRFGGDETSDALHENSFTIAVETVVEQPWGRGLATGAGAGQRASVDEALVAENQFFQIGTQLGIVAMVLYLALLAALVVTLRRRAARTDDDRSRSAMMAAHGALIGLLVGCWYLQPYVTFTVAWTLFALAGAGLGAADAERDGVAGARPLALFTASTR